jgi:hypothetical protein
MQHHARCGDPDADESGGVFEHDALDRRVVRIADVGTGRATPLSGFVAGLAHRSQE